MTSPNQRNFARSNMEVRVQCDVCQKQFTCRRQLNRHFYNVHVRQRRYCDFCHKSYMRNIDRINHMRSAHNSSPLTSGRRSPAARRSIEVNKNAKTDNHRFRQRRYCDFCPKSYRRNNHRLRHMRSAHNSCALTSGKRSPKSQTFVPKAMRSMKIKEDTKRDHQRLDHHKTPEAKSKLVDPESNPQTTDNFTAHTADSSCKQTPSTGSTAFNKGDFCTPLKSTVPKYRCGYEDRSKLPVRLAERGSEQAMFYDLEKQFNRCVITAERLIADISRKKNRLTLS